MVKSCSVNGCTNRFSKEKKITFHSLPKDNERKLKWLTFLNRKVTPKTVYICGEHFITGEKSNDKNHPDYVPTITKSKHISKSPSKLLASSSSLRRSMRYKKIINSRLQNHHHCCKNKYSKQSEVSANDQVESPVVEENVNEQVVGEPHLSDAERIQQLEDIIFKQKLRIEKLESELVSSKRTIHALNTSKHKLNTRLCTLTKCNKNLNMKLLHANETLNNSFFKSVDDVKKIRFYTGLPSLEIFDYVFELVKDHVDRDDTHAKLSRKQEFIIVLMRLRLGLLEEDLAYRFGVAQSTISRILSRWISVMASRMSFIIQWPERDQLCKTMPSCFRDNFKQCVIILDCFEVFIEKPSDLTARAQTYSQYKHHNTVKVLLGITPQGTISFVSEPWGGRTSDVHLTNNSGVLENLIPGDVVMADRGFTIAESVGLYCAELKIPQFTKGKAQLNKKDIDGTRDLATVRIHVERVIGLLRNKYTLLQKILPIKMLMKKSDGTCTLSEILIICSALCNLNASVVPLD